MGTTPEYFSRFRYGRKQALAFASGKPFGDVFDAVLGAEVANSLGYRLNDPIIITHGLGNEGFSKHDDLPFKIVGILKQTGTPVDRTIHVDLKGIEAIHLDWKGGARIPGAKTNAEKVRRMTLTPKQVTAILVGTKSKFAIFGLQRKINQMRREPLLAILPGVALQELWGLMGTAENALSFISGAVIVAGLLGMTTMLLSGLNERRREMAILRSVGARSAQIFAMLLLEAFFLSVLGALCGVALLYLGLFIAQPIVNSHFGLYLEVSLLNGHELSLLALVIIAGVLSGILPAYRALKRSLADGDGCQDLSLGQFEPEKTAFTRRTFQNRSALPFFRPGILKSQAPDPFRLFCGCPRRPLA